MTEQEKFEAIVDRFDTAMLVTRDGRGELRARPLTIAQRDSDGSLWFFTSIESGKAFEIDRESSVAVVLQGKRRFVSISGRAELVREQARLEELWRESFRPWFPNGPLDSSAVAVRVTPVAGEYWDLSGSAGLAYMGAAIASVFSGEKMSDAPEASYHGRVQGSR